MLLARQSCLRLGRVYVAHTLFFILITTYCSAAEQSPDLDEIRVRFMDFVDNHLSKRANQLDVVPIRKLALNVATNDFSRVDHWMELVRQSNVEDLCLFVQTDESKWDQRFSEAHLCYEFPFSVLASKGLRSLYVRSCKFTSQTFVGDPIGNKNRVSFSSLQQLYLCHVVLDEDGLGSLVCCCPGIEIIDLNNCTVLVELLQLSRFPKLKKALFGFQFGLLEKVNIEHTNLECFKCDTDGECLISRPACGSIRELTLTGCTLNQPNLLEDLTTTCPLIEEAELEIRDMDGLKATSYHLKKLMFHSRGSSTKEVHVDCPNLTWFECNTRGLNKFHINCPNLRRFRYVDNSLPTVALFSSSVDLLESSFELRLKCVPNTLWFINFRKFLAQTTGRVAYVHLTFSSPMAVFNIEEHGAIQVFKECNVDLVVGMLFKAMLNSNMASFVDGLLWSTRPTTLRVYNNFYDFIKYMCEKLAKRFEDILCPEKYCDRCWWQCIEDFEVEDSLGVEDVKGNLAVFVEQCRSRDISSPRFKFHWRSNRV